MWNKNKHVEDTKAFLGKGAEFSGKLIFKGNVRIDGDFQGEIFGEGSLDIGEGAVVKANINVHSVYVGGDVEGKVDVKDKLNIHATGRLTGDVSTPVFIMEEGALFEGTSRMKDLKEKKNIVRVVD
jgi:cytoskeletal protein CcmA (bactofilin family)